MGTRMAARRISAFHAERLRTGGQNVGDLGMAEGGAVQGCGDGDPGGANICLSLESENTREAPQTVWIPS
jgi:hypothetical protein